MTNYDLLDIKIIQSTLRTLIIVSFIAIIHFISCMFLYGRPLYGGISTSIFVIFLFFLLIINFLFKNKNNNINLLTNFVLIFAMLVCFLLISLDMETLTTAFLLSFIPMLAYFFKLNIYKYGFITFFCLLFFTILIFSFPKLRLFLLNITFMSEYNILTRKQLFSGLSYMHLMIIIYTIIFHNINKNIFSYKVENKKLIEKLDAHKNFLQEENKNYERDLETAEYIQTRLLLSDEEINKIKNTKISTYFIPATKVGGDYFDIIKDDNSDDFIFAIGDVTGHGLDSGLFSTIMRSTVRVLRNLVFNSNDKQNGLLNIMDKINELFCESYKNANKSGTLLVGYTDFKNNKAYYIGFHEKIIKYSRFNNLEIIDTKKSGFYLGIEENTKKFFKVSSFDFNVGDLIILYSDGITEMTYKKNQLQLKGFIDLIDKYKNININVSKLKENLIKEITKYYSNEDDVSLIIMRRIV